MRISNHRWSRSSNSRGFITWLRYPILYGKSPLSGVLNCEVAAKCKFKRQLHITIVVAFVENTLSQKAVTTSKSLAAQMMHVTVRMGKVIDVLLRVQHLGPFTIVVKRRGYTKFYSAFFKAYIKMVHKITISCKTIISRNLKVSKIIQSLGDSV